MSRRSKPPPAETFTHARQEARKEGAIVYGHLEPEDVSAAALRGLVRSVELSLSVLRTARWQAAAAEELIGDLPLVFTSIETTERHLTALRKSLESDGKAESTRPDMNTRHLSTCTGVRQEDTAGDYAQSAQDDDRRRT